MDVVKRLREYCVCDDGYPEQCAECAGAEEITTLRATIEAKDAEIADLKHDTDELIRVRREVIKRADAAEARVEELEKSPAIEDCNICGGGGVMFHADADKEVVCLCVTRRIAALERELARAKKDAAFWEDELVGSKNAINGLLEELAEAKRDTARLDWLQERMFLVENIRLDRVAGGSLLTEQCSRPGRNVEFNGSTLRAAIDKAKQRQEPQIEKEQS